MNKFLASSANPEKLSLTIKGILTGLIPLFFLIAQLKGASISEIEITNIIDVLGIVIMSIAAMISAVMTLIGLVRKIVIKFNI